MMDYSGKALTDTYPSRALCGKRLDNGLPFASSSNGLPHTCLEDVVMVPLASWLFYLALLAAVAFAARRGRNGQGEQRWKAMHMLIYRRRSAEEGRSYPTTWTHRWPKTATFLSILYSLLVLATLLMNVLEIVRLYLADRGAGLLPFTLASLLFVLVLMHTPFPGRFYIPLSLAILTFWLFSLVFTSVKLATLSRLEDVEPRLETEYLDSDQLIDVGVIVGLYALELIVESCRLIRFVRSPAYRQDGQSLASKA